MNLVWSYGLHAPHEGAKIVEEQMRMAARYQNTLIQIERGRRAAVREIESQVGDLPKARAELEAARTETEEIAAAARRWRAKTRLKKLPESMADALKAAREKERELRRIWLSVRRAIASTPAMQDARDAIGERAKELYRSARAHCGVFWGTYLLIEDAVTRSSRLPLYEGDLPYDPRFVRYDGSGSVAVQLQGGLSVGDALSGTDTRLRIQPPDRRAWSGRRSDRRRYGSTAELALRVGSNGRDPVWAKWILDMNRPVPQDATIKWAKVVRRKHGPHSRWELQLTLVVPDLAPIRASVGGAVAVDLGWRMVGDEIRVAGWQDQHGTKGELRLDKETIRLLALPSTIRAERDVNLDRIRLALLWWRACGGQGPWWLEDALDMMPQWRSPARFARLLRTWQPFPGDELPKSWLEWYVDYIDAYAWEAETEVRRRSLLRRREIYRIFAAKLARSYDSLVLEKFDLREIARRKPVGQDAPENETARSNRVVVAPSELRLCLKNAARSRFRDCFELAAEDTTRKCPSCGVVRDRDAKDSITLRCDCGASWDQDVDGAPVELLRRFEQADETTKLSASRRTGEESRWAKAKRLAVEKSSRIQAARESAGKPAE